MPEEGDKSISNIGTDVAIAVVVFLVGLGLLGAYFNSIFGWYKSVLEWLYSYNWRTFIVILSVVFGMIDILLIGFIIFIFKKHAKLDKIMPAEPPISLPVHVIPLNEEVKNIWEEIKRLENSGNSSDWSIAIIRADGLLDDALKHLGYEGQTMADKLKIIDSFKLPSIDRVWSAHRLRNTIVHGPMEDHARETIVHALQSYQIALKELGVLQEVKS